MDEGFFQVVIYIIIAIIWMFFGGSKKKKTATAKKAVKKTTQSIGDGQPTLQELLNKIRPKEEPEKERDSRYMSTEIYGDPNAKKPPGYMTKKGRLKPFKKKKKHIFIEELLDDKESLKKAFIMSEIFKRKF